MSCPVVATLSDLHDFPDRGSHAAIPAPARILLLGAPHTERGPLRPLSAQTPDMSARMTPLAGMLEDHFFRAVFIESIATASTMMPPLMMYCQYGFTPMYDRP